MTGVLGTLVVLALATAVGVLVYRLTAGTDGPTGGRGAAGPDADADVAEWRGRDTDPLPGAGVSGGGASTDVEPRQAVPEGYIPVAPGGPSWNSRLGGLMGLVIAIGAGAIALALALYALGELVARLVSSAGNGAPGA
jgi:hypothetical protein